MHIHELVRGARPVGGAHSRQRGASKPARALLKPAETTIVAEALAPTRILGLREHYGSMDLPDGSKIEIDVGASCDWFSFTTEVQHPEGHWPLAFVVRLRPALEAIGNQIVEALLSERRRASCAADQHWAALHRDYSLDGASHTDEPRLERPAPRVQLRAWCWAGGVIEFGPIQDMPDGALPIALGPWGAVVEAVTAQARHAYGNGCLLVPGVPEAADEFAAVDAVTAFARRVRWTVACLCESDEGPWPVGSRVTTLLGESDEGEDGPREAAPGEVGTIARVEHHPDGPAGERWYHHVTFETSGVSVIIFEGELADPELYQVGAPS